MTDNELAEKQIELIMNGDMLHGMELHPLDPVSIKTRFTPEHKPLDLWFSGWGKLRNYDPILDNSMKLVVELDPVFMTSKMPAYDFRSKHGIAVEGIDQSEKDKLGCLWECAIENWELGIPFIRQLISGHDLEIGAMFRTGGYLNENGDEK